MESNAEIYLKEITPFIRYITHRFYLRSRNFRITWDEIYSEMLFVCWKACSAYKPGKVKLTTFTFRYMKYRFYNMLASYNTYKNQILMRAEDIYDPGLEEDLVVDSSYWKEDSIDKKDAQLSINDILSEEEIRFLLLRYGLDLTYREVGAILGKNRQTCHNKIVNIINKIRNYLPKED